jgi:hypothetical protein
VADTSAGRSAWELDEQGNIKSAHYGKIYGDFLNFCYYFNPDSNSLNMEFDPGRNLASDPAAVVNER